eukprot:3467510-Pyramimonas_sp.AAC.1
MENTDWLHASRHENSATPNLNALRHNENKHGNDNGGFKKLNHTRRGIDLHRKTNNIALN